MVWPPGGVYCKLTAIGRMGVASCRGHTMLKEFREFALKGNVVDVAVGIMIGAAFGTIVSSLVADVLMPVVGLAIGGMDFTNVFLILKDGTPARPYLTQAEAKAAGAVTINIGLF